ncbi:hypothetical protein B5X24_HaOG202150 [Helicoverpa armigera]|uniref:Uncharacterized protein n=1 Tax=Helicoverpa armigera TaxID=29058 RepID=A0A2W1BXV6_HELAM|nr:hypothetical protein B5X24_HaOG202150 [Helicoverpa armigera]
MPAILVEVDEVVGNIMILLLGYLLKGQYNYKFRVTRQRWNNEVNPSGKTWGVGRDKKRDGTRTPTVLGTYPVLDFELKI